MRPRRLRQPEQPRHEQLPRRRVDEVRAPHDLADALFGVVDHHGQVVRRRAVVAPHHEVVDDGLDPPQQPVLEADPLRLGAHAQRRRPAARALAPPLAVGQAQAGARVGALRQRPVRRRGRRPDLRPRAEALVDPARGPQLGDRRLVRLAARGLPQHLAVPVEPDRGQVLELLGRGVHPHPPGVEVLHPHEEPRALRAREQPRQQRGAQVADVQRARRAGREAAVGVHAPYVKGNPSAISASRGASRSRSL